MAVADDEPESWPRVRALAICPTCQGEKRIGSLACANCRETKMFGEIIRQLDATEGSLRWKEDRKPNRPAARRSTDPVLTPCPACKSSDVLFWRSEAAGRSVNHVVQPIVDHFVKCSACGMQTLQRTSKKQAALDWKNGRHILKADSNPWRDGTVTPIGNPSQD